MKLNSLTKNYFAIVRDFVVKTLTQSNLYLKQNEVDYAIKQLDESTALSSFIPSDIIEKRSWFSESEINKFLDAALIDNILQYNTLKQLYESLDEIDYYFNNKVQAILDNILEYESKVNVYTKLKVNPNEYNNIIHETFNYDNNYDGTDRRLVVNKIAGTLRLDSESILLSTKEKSNISYELITNGVTIIDSSDIDNIYSRDKFKPWYLSLISRGYLKNSNYNNIELETYQGVVVLLRIQFPSMQQFNRITYTYFSTDTMDLLGVFYSEQYNQDLNSVNLKKADIGFYQDAKDVNKELNLTEIEEDNSQIMNAVEILIVFGQKDYINIDNAIDYETYINNEDLLKIIKKQEFNNRLNTYSLHNTSNLFSKEIIERAYKKLEIKPGNRNYLLGLSLFSIENIYYVPYGTYRSKNFKLNGNLYGFSLEVSKKEEFTIRDSTELLFLNINGKRLPIGIIEGNKVTDSCLLTSIADRKNVFLGKVNFIPKLLNYKFGSSAIVYLDGILINNNAITFTRATETGYEFEILSDIAHDNSIVTLEYEFANKDHYNANYYPNKIDIPKVLGKPHLDVNFPLYNNSDYIYLTADDSTCVSFIEGAELSLTFVSEIAYFVLEKTKAKGKTFDNIATIDPSFNVDYYYFNLDKVDLVENEIYYIIKDYIPLLPNGEFATWTNCLNLYGTAELVPEIIDLTIPNPGYIKNLIILSVNESQFKLNDLQQYSIDNDTTIYPKNIIHIEKNLLVNSNNIKVYYAPINGKNSSSISSNILQHNQREIFTKTNNLNINLDKYPYVDTNITTSDNWILSDGTFFNAYNYSITYEPFLVRVNGEKAFNSTRYKESNTTFDTNKILYTVNENQLIFNREFSEAQIIVDYYYLGDTFSFEIEMYKADNSKYYTTPEIKDITILTAVKK